jgi:hypothetical protein
MPASAEQNAWVARVLGLAVGEGGGEGEQREQAARRWRSERAIVVAALQQLSRAIVKSGDPEAAKAFIRIQAIAKNITAEPTTPQQVAELQTYLTTEKLIADAEKPNPFGIAIDIRKPLLGALGPLKDAAAG